MKIKISKKGEERESIKERTEEHDELDFCQIAEDVEEEAQRDEATKEEKPPKRGA